MRCLWTGKKLVSLPSALSPKTLHLSAYSHSNNKLTFICLPQKHLESYLADCYDAIAVFLCIHIVLRFRNIAAKRDVPDLDRSLSSGPWCLDVVSFLCYENSSILTLGSASPDALHSYSHSCVPGAALVWGTPTHRHPEGCCAPLGRLHLSQLTFDTD